MAVVPQPVDNATMMLRTREYCAFGVQNNISCVPIDNDEDDLFNAFHKLLSDHDILPTVPPEFSPGIDNPRVLDCGYGSGIWIEELMDIDAYMYSEVTGVDIFIRPTSGVQEFYKEQWNLNAPLPTGKYWLKEDTFDLINSRFLVDGIDECRWVPLLEECKKLLKHRAWLQTAEVQWTFHSKSNHDLPALKRWSDEYYRALRNMQKKPGVVTVERLEQVVRFAGFQHVVGTTHDILIGEWRAEDDRDEGPASMISYVHGILSSFAFVPFTQALKLSPEECMDVVQAAQAELRTRNANIFFKLTVVYGQRALPTQ